MNYLDERKEKIKHKERYTLREVYENEGVFRCFGQEPIKIVEALEERFHLCNEWGKRNEYVWELKGNNMKIRILSSKNVLRRAYIRYYNGNFEGITSLIWVRKKLKHAGLERRLWKGYDIE